jgi:prepilin-type N-terminal cleavage/methylation domain-containing protein
VRASPTSEAGFTLVEIAVAVAILGVALVSLIGLHTRMMNTYINEENRFQAALVLQYIASMIEVEAEAPEAGTFSVELESKLQEYGFFDTDSPEEKKQFRFEGWRFEQNVESLGLPFQREELSEDAIRRISLRLTWGPSEDEQFSLVYFVAPPLEVPAGLGGAASAAQNSAATGGAEQ